MGKALVGIGFLILTAGLIASIAVGLQLSNENKSLSADLASLRSVQAEREYIDPSWTLEPVNQFATLEDLSVDSCEEAITTADMNICAAAAAADSEQAIVDYYDERISESPEEDTTEAAAEKELYFGFKNKLCSNVYFHNRSSSIRDVLSLSCHRAVDEAVLEILNTSFSAK